MRYALWAILLGGVCVPSVHAQFMVQPMIYQIQASPRQKFATTLLLENRGQDEVKYVQISLLEMGQRDSGTWEPINPRDPGASERLASRTGHRSCKDWIRLTDLPANGKVEVPILDRSEVSMQINVPAGVRGFFTACIVASLGARPDEEGVVVRYDFVIPVLITIKGAALPKRIDLVDAGLEHIPAQGGVPSSTLLTLGVANTGGTYGKIVGLANLTQILKDDKTRLVKKDIIFDAVGIIPGSRLKLAEDITKDLPTGTYRVKAALYVDGKQSKSITQRVEFVGSQGSGGAAREDAAIRVVPPLVKMESSPGRARSTVVTVWNNADELVTITARAFVPNALSDKVYASEQLDGLSCAAWLTVKPAEFTVRSFSKRNVRLSLKMPDRSGLPKWSSDPGAYYANLRLYAFYDDDSPAGVTDTSVCVLDKTVQAAAFVEKRGLKIEGTGKSKFDVVATFLNLSLIHIEPTCMVGMYLLDGSVEGTQASYDRLENTRMKDAIMLPLESRAFSRELDLSKMVPGNYRLEASCILGEGADLQTFRQSQLIEVFIKRDGVERDVALPRG